MGYTHYWRRLREFDEVKFAAAVADCWKFCDALPIPIGDGHGEGVPIFNKDMIAFNGHVDSGSFSRDGAGLNWPAAKAQGVKIAGTDAQIGNWFAGNMLSGRAVDANGDGSYESFIVQRVKESGEWQKDNLYLFDCCKTNFRPYDLLVQGCLIILKEHLGPAILVSSDGDCEQWNEARDGVQRFCGFGLIFDLDTPEAIKAAEAIQFPKAPKVSRGCPGRDETIKRIRTALQKRSGKQWSVTGGRGTAWGWITIDAPPRRRKWHFKPTDRYDYRGRQEYDEYYDETREFGHTGPADRKELAELLGFDPDTDIHHQGHSIASSSGHYWEYIDRAEGREPLEYGKQYWD